VEEGKYGNRNLELPTFSGTCYKPNKLTRNSFSFRLSINLIVNNVVELKRGVIIL